MTRSTGRQPAAERQSALLRAHREWITAYGEEPSVRELSAAVGLSPSMVSHHLTQMRAEGSRGGDPGPAQPPVSALRPLTAVGRTGHPIRRRTRCS
ncbi:ArsR family transcriptional regulator [Streptomyces sp. NPDC002088]|uniref:LexA family protein n=1 Tax=Streptomyces sp. NPDC002088 TaxID=3154665 RepID=UPI003318E0C5